MQYRAIFFDMDGTLLPMDTDLFVKGYFKELCKKVCPYGIEPQVLVDAIWSGTHAMVKNDGTQRNETVFWNDFQQRTGIDSTKISDATFEFYCNEFRSAKAFTGENPLAAVAVHTAHEKAPIVALATNPIFPMPAQDTRMSWIGLQASDFDLVTCYETDSFAKPNPAYYLSVCERLGVKPEECLMIGNDEREDMWAATQAGLNCYLVTDCLIPCEEHPWHGPRGTFAEMVDMLQGLDACD